MLALRFNLDGVTTMYNSPQAALLFWGSFTVVVLLIVGVTLWVYRRMRPH
jgi:hypothetical protein